MASALLSPSAPPLSAAGVTISAITGLITGTLAARDSGVEIDLHGSDAVDGGLTLAVVLNGREAFVQESPDRRSVMVSMFTFDGSGEGSNVVVVTDAVESARIITTYLGLASL